MNQDKTSKQMSTLRIEIQKLTMELMEFKQVTQLDPSNSSLFFFFAFPIFLD